MKLRMLVVGFVLVGSPAWAQAGTRGPTDAELKSAYCITILKGEVGSIRHFKDGIEADTSPTGLKNNQIAQRLIDKMGDDLSRLQAYLLPKLQSIDPTALVTAEGRAQVDWSAASKNYQTDEHPELKSEAQRRVESCDTVNWLPF
jgi:hypothetical protein